MLLVFAVIFAIVFREGTLGNVASMVGLAVSILGFIVTIWTVQDARQQIREAGDRARQETRRTIEGIAAQLLAADCAALRRGVEDLRQAAQDAKWPRAVYRCQECRNVAYRLADDQRLVNQEMSQLRAAADDLQLILRFIERNRLGGQPGLLQDRHVQSLDEVVGLLARIQARLHHEPLRPGP